FANPSYNLSVGFRMMRFALMVAAAVLGLYGLTLGFILIITHLARLKSFNIPYLEPFVAMRPNELKDTIFRTPLFNMIRRPYPANKNIIRMRNNRPIISKKTKGGQNDGKK
ncbi:MAG TPA: spore germination protein, partial [Clostridiales bacterium]|nr:spore germination protein [Clostridiales bacterium]